MAGSVPWLGSWGSTWLVAMVRLAVEGDQGDVADLGAGGQAGLGLDGVAEVALAAAGAVLGRQEAGQDVGRQRRGRVERLEDGADLAGGRVEAQLDLDAKAPAVVGHWHRGEVVLTRQKS